MRIKRENIVIRSAKVEDANQLYRWWNDGNVMEHAGFPNGIGQKLDMNYQRIIGIMDKR